MEPVDREVLRLTPGSPPRVAILPTAAGQEDVTPWITNGVSHFERLGCVVDGVRATDRSGVENPELVARLEAADLVYLSGGSPGYLTDTLRDSAALRAIVAVWQRGGTLAGSSAGAMAVCQWTLVRRSGDAGWMPSHWAPGLNLLPGVGVIPHYDRFGPERTTARLADVPPGVVVLGIDEDTVVLHAANQIRVLGRRSVTVWRDGQSQVFETGQEIPADVVLLP